VKGAPGGNVLKNRGEMILEVEVLPERASRGRKKDRKK
jgi:hypothetical protein